MQLNVALETHVLLCDTNGCHGNRRCFFICFGGNSLSLLHVTALGSLLATICEIPLFYRERRQMLTFPRASVFKVGTGELGRSSRGLLAWQARSNNSSIEAGIFELLDGSSFLLIDSGRGTFFLDNSGGGHAHQNGANQQQKHPLQDIFLLLSRTGLGGAIFCRPSEQVQTILFLCLLTFVALTIY